jgi:hypothetical protein
MLGRQAGNNDSRSSLLGGLRGRESALGLGRGRMVGWQRVGESSGGGDGRTGLLRGGRSGLGGGGIVGSGVGPLTLVAGAKKLFQDVSEDTLNGIPAFPHDANALTGRALSHDCTTTNGRPDGSSNGAHGLSRPSPLFIAPAIT